MMSRLSYGGFVVRSERMEAKEMQYFNERWYQINLLFAFSTASVQNIFSLCSLGICIMDSFFE